MQKKKKKLFELFPYKYFSENLIVSSNYRDRKTQRPKTDQKHHGIGLPQSSDTAMCWTFSCQ